MQGMGRSPAAAARHLLREDRLQHHISTPIIWHKLLLASLRVLLSALHPHSEKSTARSCAQRPSIDFLRSFLYRYALASSMSLNASSIALSSSSPALFTGVAASSLELLHAHTPRLAVPDMAAGGSVSRTSSAGSAGAGPSRELHPLSLAWDGGGTSSAKVTSSASQGGGDNPFMLADSSDDDGLSGRGMLVREQFFRVLEGRDAAHF
jgi:hypothetical protein